jgi:hypothetical protein
MWLTRVAKGIKQGSLLGEGRFIIHKPWDTKINKAGDRFINLHTLGKMASKDDFNVRRMAALNIAQRINGDEYSQKDMEFIFTKFDKQVLMEALSRVAVSNEKLANYVPEMQEMFKENFDPNNAVHRRTIINVARLYQECVRDTYAYLEPTLKREEVEQLMDLVKDMDLINGLMEQTHASNRVIAKGIIKLTPKTQKVVIKEEQGHFEPAKDTVDTAQGTGVCLPPHSGEVESSVYVLDNPESSYLTFGTLDVEVAMLLIKSGKRDTASIKNIIGEIEKFEPMLAERMLDTLVM